MSEGVSSSKEENNENWDDDEDELEFGDESRSEDTDKPVEIQPLRVPTTPLFIKATLMPIIE